MPIIAGLRRFPLKSARALPETSILRLRASGPLFDRRLMIVTRESDGSWRFVSQRDAYGRILAHVRCSLFGEQREKIVFMGPRGDCLVEAPTRRKPLIEVELHKRPVRVHEMELEHHQWASALIGREAMMVRTPEEPTRPVPKLNAPREAFVGLADADQLLVISTATLQEVRKRSGLDYTEVIDRLRPNVIVGTRPDEKPLEPFEEDTWADCLSRGVELQGTTPCGRCSIICVNQTTGELEPAKSPTNLLHLFHKSDRWRTGPFLNPDMPKEPKVYLGMNFAYRYAGDLDLGGPWQILSRQNPWQRV